MAKKKSKKKTIIALSILGIVLIVGSLAIFSDGKGKTISVTTSLTVRKTITQSVAAIGKIQPETEVKISSETSGEIVFLGVKEGDTVRAGQLLVRIKPDIIETQLEQVQAAADASKLDIEVRAAERDRVESELKRITDLYKKQFASQQELERIKAAYDQSVSGYKQSLSMYERALASLREMKRNAERTTITAPITGVVTSLSVEKGEKVVGTAMMQGSEMMRIADLGVMNAVVDVDENDIILVKRGDTTEIEIDAIQNRVFKGIVVEIGHSAKVNQLGTQDQVTNFEVKIRLLESDARMRPGMSCNVEIHTLTRHNVLAVPLQAVTVRDTSVNRQPDLSSGSRGIEKKDDSEEKTKVKRPPSVVFLKESNSNKVKMTQVETGISDKGFIEVTKGLSDGDEIVSGSYDAVSRQLFDGAEIKIDTVRAVKPIKK